MLLHFHVNVNKLIITYLKMQLERKDSTDTRDIFENVSQMRVQLDPAILDLRGTEVHPQWIKA